jgi:uncharacterized membrane protein YdbT with pleckstrin-like domain
MIPLGEPQHLGFKAYVLMVIEYVSPAIGIVIVALILTLFDEILVDAFANLAGIMYPDTAYTADQISLFLGWIIFILLGLATIILALGIIAASLVYHFYTYTIENHDLRLKRGVLHKEEISIPFRQMQNVNIIRSLFYQLLGVSKLYIDSAGHETPGQPDKSEIILKPIEKEIAEEIRSLLEHRIGVQLVEDSTTLGRPTTLGHI